MHAYGPAHLLVHLPKLYVTLILLFQNGKNSRFGTCSATLSVTDLNAARKINGALPSALLRPNTGTNKTG